MVCIVEMVGILVEGGRMKANAAHLLHLAFMVFSAVSCPPFKLAFSHKQEPEHHHHHRHPQAIRCNLSDAMKTPSLFRRSSQLMSTHFPCQPTSARRSVQT